MAIIMTDSKYYGEIAEAIREKNGTTNSYTPSQMGLAITAIESGSSENNEEKWINRSFTEYSNSSLTEIGSYTFAGMNSLSKINFPACVSIGSAAFQGCSSLTSIDFPVCINIDYSAFVQCKSLTSVNFPACTNIGSNAFRYCSSLTSVNFPNCNTIDNYAFGQCSSLTSVNFPVCTVIGNGVFSQCRSLTSVYFPVCASIASNAFGYCSALTSVNFPACININASAFYYCTSLSTATFSKLNIIYSSAFRSCTSLMSFINSYSSVATLSNINVFQSTPMSLSTYTGTFGSIYVPASLVDAYKSATNWATYANRITSMYFTELIQPNNVTLLFNQSENISVKLRDFLSIPNNCEVISSDESIVQVSNIQTTNENITFDLISYEKEGNAQITVSTIYENEIYTKTFNIQVLGVPYWFDVENLNTAYGFELNNNGYYESNNRHINSSYAICKININTKTDTIMYVDCINEAEAFRDYGILSNLDTELDFNASADASEKCKVSFSTSQTEEIQTIEYSIPAGNHFIYIKYIKDSNNISYGNDSLQFKIRFGE